MQAASDWSKGIISTAFVSPTGSRGEYFRIAGIQSDGCIDTGCPRFFENPFKTFLRPPFRKCKTYRQYADIKVRIWN